MSFRNIHHHFSQCQCWCFDDEFLVWNLCSISRQNVLHKLSSLQCQSKLCACDHHHINSLLQDHLTFDHSHHHHKYFGFKAEALWSPLTVRDGMWRSLSFSYQAVDLPRGQPLYRSANQEISEPFSLSPWD